MGSFLFLLLFCCGATIVIEWIPLFFISRRKGWLKASILCNIVTNPLLNTLLCLFAAFTKSDTAFLVITIMLEIGVVFLEAWFYKRLMRERFVKCFGVSLLANGLSFGIGMVLF